MDWWQRLVRNKLIWSGGSIIIMFVIAAIFADFITSYPSSKQAIKYRLLSPGKQGHLFGTDEFGRDIWSRVVYGARVSINISFTSVSIALIFGTFLGLISGYFGARSDMIIGRLMDIMMAFPSLLLALLIVAILGASLTNSMIAIGITLIPRFYRVVRASTFVVKERVFVIAAKVLGRSNFGTILRHIVPNIISPLLVSISLAMGNAILTEAELSFLGLGAQPPTPSWGSIVAGGKEYLDSAPWISGIGGLVVLLIVLGFNLLGDGFRDLLDPKLKK